MRVIDQANLAQKSLRRHPLRFILTMLGMIIGVASIVAMVSIGLGARNQVEAEIARLGTNLLTIHPTSRTTERLPSSAAGRHNLTEDDASALADEVLEIRHAVPVVNGKLRLVHGNSNWKTSLVGTLPGYIPARDWAIDVGRSFTIAEVTSSAKVAVLGKTVEEKLSPGRPLVGEVIRVKDVPFRVIGVLEEKGHSTNGIDQDDLIIVPISSAKRKLLGGYYQVSRKAVGYILVKTASTDKHASVQSSAKNVLRHRHGIGSRAGDDFVVRDPTAALSASKSASETLTLLLASVAAVSLIVGGISIMNIMLVSVAERTREIGIRTAVGATRGDILGQFLVEAAGVAFVGGMIGAVAGVSVAHLIESTAGWEVDVELWVPAAALSFSMAVGLLSGLYPALKASELDPIEAMRHE